MGQGQQLADKPRVRSPRSVIREVLLEFDDVNSPRTVAQAVIERMSASEQQAALAALLPRLVREVHNKQAREASEFFAGEEHGHAAQVDELVWVRGRDMRLGDADAGDLDVLASHRGALGTALLGKAKHFTALAAELRSTGLPQVQELPGELVAKLLGRRREVRQREVEAKRRKAVLELLGQQVAAAEAAGESLSLAAARQERDAMSARVEAARKELLVRRQRVDAMARGIHPALIELGVFARLRESVK